MIHRICFIIVILLVSACTVGHVHYAMVSTKQDGIFSERAAAETQAVEVGKAEPEFNETNLDKLVEQSHSSLDYSRYALIIGIENYQKQANVNYADNSARTFSLAARHVLGIPTENTIVLTNEKATSGQIKTNIAYLAQLAEPGDSLYFFFAGHGVPGTDGNSYILPADMSADAIEIEPGLMLDNIYRTLNNSAADKVYIFIDSCFSGRDDKGELLFKGVAPIFKQAPKKAKPKKLVIMTAGGQSEFANQLKGQQQRMFSYYLIKGLAEKRTDIDELYNYVKRNVKRSSLRIGLGYKQIPQLQK
ncbi:MAG: caspase family protein [Gammaproteobacteria bacterium]|nr:caspase family protein [Gammaproteobacteria bacterium]